MRSLAASVPASGGTGAAVPRHVAIIMDGNGRWAKARGLPRAAGHRAGVEALRSTVRAVGDLGIDWLTVYAFSSENWSRPKSEVSDLMGLLKLFIRRDLAELHQSGVRVRVIGRRDGLDPEIGALLHEAEALTAQAKTNLDLFQRQYDAGTRQVMDVVSVYETFLRALEKQLDLTFQAARAELDAAKRLGVLADGAKI